MLIVFIAFVAMFDAILGSIRPLLLSLNVDPAHLPDWLNGLSLGRVFGWIFSPVAFLMGVAKEDMARVGSLLGSKLSINEHYAYLEMRQLLPKTNPVTGAFTPGLISERSFRLTAFALTGFANFSSVGIQLGGIGGIAPNRRQDLARLGMRALFVGFTATLLNAAVAGILLPDVIEPVQPTPTVSTAAGAKETSDTPQGTATPEAPEKGSTVSPSTSPDKTSPEKAAPGTSEKDSTKQGSVHTVARELFAAESKSSLRIDAWQRRCAFSYLSAAACL